MRVANPVVIRPLHPRIGTDAYLVISVATRRLHSPYGRAEGTDEEGLTDTETEADQDAQCGAAPTMAGDGAAAGENDAAAEPVTKRQRTALKAMSRTRWTGLAKVSLVRFQPQSQGASRLHCTEDRWNVQLL
jgi:hypothetical protein